jgi:hypothetical protein
VSGPRRPPPRWSKSQKTDELVRYVASRCRPALQSELGQWLDSSARFHAFVTTHQDKVRKKFKQTSDDEESRQDVRAELLVARLLLEDRRFAVAFEAYGAGRVGPDLSVTYRAHQRFNLEVTRLRASADADDASPDAIVSRLANIVAGKLRQLPAGVPNALVIAARGQRIDEEHLTRAVRLVQNARSTASSASRSREDSLAARGAAHSARSVEPSRRNPATSVNLSGVFVIDDATTPMSVLFAANREARHSLSTDVLKALTSSLAAYAPRQAS